MTIFIIGGILVIFVLFRKQLEKLVLSLVLKFKNRKPQQVKITTADGIFAPNGTVRTFNLTLEVHELGNGTAKIVIAKK